MAFVSGMNVLAQRPVKSHNASASSSFISSTPKSVRASHRSLPSKLRMDATPSSAPSVVSSSSPSSAQGMMQSKQSLDSMNTEQEIEQIMNQKGWHVHKFGGSSVGDAERILAVAKLIRSEQKDGRKIFVVLSAVGGVTNKLIKLVENAASRDKEQHYLEGIEVLRDIHENIAEKVLPTENRATFLASLSSDLRDIRDLLRGIWIARSASEQLRELISGYGELWSTQLVWGVLQSPPNNVKCSWMDARDVLMVRKDAAATITSRRLVAWDQSQRNLENWLKINPTDVVICTGFIATGTDGVSTTLGRNGSDYSATCFAKLLNAAVCEIWTDVDGVYSADPRSVPDAIVIDSLSYKEAAELAYFGAKVLHPDSMSPLVSNSIPMRIRNSYNPSAIGTLVRTDRVLSESDVKILDPSVGVKGFSIMDNISLVNVEGSGMIGVPGIAGRMFNALFEANISCILIAQASSEYSICAAIPAASGEAAERAIRRAFSLELSEKIISAVTVVPSVSILAMVGENMQKIPGVCARLFDSLSSAGVNVVAMAQGSSERNISVVIKSEDQIRALRAAHSAFYLSYLTMGIGLVGPGVVGSVLVKQILEQREDLKREFGVDIQVHGILTSKKMLLSDSPHGLDLETWRAKFDACIVPGDVKKFAEHLKKQAPHVVICDCTSSQDIANEYETWLSQGISVTTPNKKANSGSYEKYKAIRRAQKTGNHSHFFYEANVGAGLPVISTIRDLSRTGDKFIEIQGIFSGTLSFIFNEFDGSVPFSTIVKQAKDAGYTEPDPRDDLSGTDVARKVVILAREIGLQVELGDIPVKSLVPKELEKVSVDEFMRRLPEFDKELADMASVAAKKGEKLRYVGVINAVDKKCSVELMQYPATHPFGALKGSDNIVLFRTARYNKQPLTVRGPGAGAEVTAGGIFADILRVASYYGGRSAAEDL
eukprot:CAMPEP_0184693870 /NCGR_PEP_ID=MMETSP0313-20130426/1994_1 /TAXON_ID=2792 /ORGANISM="Porphyridium aerugineum, Strain SAG 1380-2" /LENGTH=940 /DNA_ID=CAMNT_0027152045 /DNA_START=254 /DNA_END=3076 /DNA_ORIENTATION=+